MANEHRGSKIAIIGGGLTGLSAAYYTQRQAEQTGRPLEVVLYEKSERLGGKIRTLRRDGFVIEAGPDSFLARKQPIIELSKLLGLSDELTGTNPHVKGTYILHRNRFHRLPEGMVMGIPTKLTPFVRTGLISTGGKIRAACDLILPARKQRSDESLGAFLGRRLGVQVQENLAEPLLSGIYAGDPSQLSVQATFPQFRALEQKHRSLIIGMLRSSQSQSASGRVNPDIPQHARGSVFLTYRNGLSTLSERLVSQLEVDGVSLRTNQAVSAIRREGNQYRVEIAEGTAAYYDAVIIALPAFRLAPLLPQWNPEYDVAASIPYASVSNVVMAFDKAAIQHPLDGTGFLVPRKEGRFITACTWTSTKWLHSAPADKVLLRFYVGRSDDDQWLRMSDEQIIERVRQDLMETMGIAEAPLFTEVTRWKKAMPQYRVGHLERIANWRQELQDSMPGVLLTGSAFEGVGLPDCIQQGKQAAEQALSHCAK